MTSIFSIIAQDGGFAIAAKDAPLLTPDKKPLVVPTQTLAEAIAGEWRGTPKYNAVRMPLTAIAYTAIDRISEQKEAIIEVLLVYTDTETLSYRVSGSESLAKKQEQQWTPILDWTGKRLDAAWEVTSGVMPVDQSPGLHKAISTYLTSLSAMQLSAACILSSGLSSLALTLAVLMRHIDAARAFFLSRLEEEHQAEQWGRDDEAESRAARLKQEILDAARFLDLLEAA